MTDEEQFITIDEKRIATLESKIKDFIEVMEDDHELMVSLRDDNHYPLADRLRCEHRALALDATMDSHEYQDLKALIEEQPDENK